MSKQFLEVTKKSKHPLSQRAKVVALLDLGMSTKEVAERLDMSTGTINQFRNQIKEGKIDDLVHEAIAISPNTVKILVDKAKETQTPKVVNQLQTLEKQLGGISKLDEKFHDTMTTVLKKADQILQKDDLKTSDLVAITNAVANAYSQIFNSKAVSVNVNNGNQFSGQSMSMFKNSLRG